MGRLRRLMSDLSDYLAAASDREKRLLLLAAFGVVFAAVMISWTSFSRTISRREDALEEKRLAFAQVQKLAQDFGAREQERQLLEARLRQSPPALVSFVDERAKAEGIEIGGVSDRGIVSSGPASAGRPRESQVEVNMAKVPLDKLTRFIQALETSPGVVKVRRLRMRRSQDQKEALDVTLSISAWQGA